MNDHRIYEIHLRWHPERNGTLSSPEIPTPIQVVVPRENSNNITEWTAEHLLVAAVNACFLSTFMAFSMNLNVGFISFECNAIATMDKINDKLIFTRITLSPTVVIVDSGYEERIRRILEISKKNSAISNLLKIKVNLEPQIIIHDQTKIDLASQGTEKVDDIELN